MADQQQAADTGVPTQDIPDERELLAALRSGDEAAFLRVVEAYQPLMLRVARLYVDTPQLAEEVVQDTWVGVLRGLAGFEGRSSLKTWVFRILANRARTRGARERRSLPFADLAGELASGEPAVAPERFLPMDDPAWPGHWAASPASWARTPEQALLAKETLAQIAAAVAGLPPVQATVLQLRDVAGLPAGEVCELLGLSEVNQRVLLHRARSRVRHALEQYLDAG